MRSSGLIVQIDESLFQGKRECNRIPGSDGNEDPNEENYWWNYGNRVKGTVNTKLVFGFCCHNGGILERRFFIVQKPDRRTLPIIRRVVECR